MYSRLTLGSLHFDGEPQTGVRVLSGIQSKALDLTVPSFCQCWAGKGNRGDLFRKWGSCAPQPAGLSSSVFRENENLLGLSYLAYEKEVCIFNRKITNGLDEKACQEQGNGGEETPPCGQSLVQVARKLTRAASLLR